MNIRIYDYLSYSKYCQECKVDKKNLFSNKECLHKLCFECLDKLNKENKPIICDCKNTFTTKDFHKNLNYENFYEATKNARKLFEDNNLRLETDFSSLSLYNNYLYNSEVTINDLLNNELREKTTNELEQNKFIHIDRNRIVKDKEILEYKKLAELLNPLNLYSSSSSTENLKKCMLLLNNQDLSQAPLPADQQITFTRQVRYPQHINTNIKRDRNLQMEKKASGSILSDHNKLMLNYFFEGL